VASGSAVPVALFKKKCPKKEGADGI